MDEKKRRVLEAALTVLETLDGWAWWQEDINNHDWRLLDERIERERQQILEALQ